MQTVSHCFSGRRVMGWIQTLCNGEAVTILECLHAINLSRNFEGVSTSPSGQENAWKSIHSRPLGIFHSRSRSSEDLHPPWISGCGTRVNAKKNIRQAREDLPEEDIAGIPEDNWDADCGPGGRPGICLGVADHVGCKTVFWFKIPTSEPG